MPGLDEFSRRMTQIAVEVGLGGDSVVRKAALACDQAVVTATPVDKGTARSNWIVQVDTASEEVIPAYLEGKAGTTAAANVQGALDQASRTVAGYDGDVSSEIHITNNLPYIAKLNAGTSSQAPAGYVEDGVAAAVAAIGEARILGG
jgi:hypothetical protein